MSHLLAMDGIEVGGMSHMLHDYNLAENSILEPMTDVAISKIQCGESVYKFLQLVELSLTPTAGNQWVCHAREFFRGVAGSGPTAVDAQHNFSEQFHVAFQKLYATPAFEMTPEQQDRWQEFVNLIDIKAYRDSAPLDLREIGEVRYGRADYPSRIDWVDGRHEHVLLEQLPPQMATYPDGQWFEAIVRRRAAGDLIKIINAQRIPPIVITQAAAEEYRASLPVADLPSAEWKWVK